MIASIGARKFLPMSSFQNDAQFAKDLVKGNLGEIIFERLAVHSGWYLRYTGDQYSKTICAVTKKVMGSARTPDFQISKSPDFKESYSVEVKYQHVFDKKASVHKKGPKENIRVVLSPGGYGVYPSSMKATLGIEEADWKFATDLLAKIL